MFSRREFIHDVEKASLYTPNAAARSIYKGIAKAMRNYYLTPEEAWIGILRVNAGALRDDAWEIEVMKSSFREFFDEKTEKTEKLEKTKNTGNPGDG
jgi:hypothetical protein